MARFQVSCMYIDNQPGVSSVVLQRFYYTLRQVITTETYKIFNNTMTHTSDMDTQDFTLVIVFPRYSCTNNGHNHTSQHYVKWQGDTHNVMQNQECHLSRLEYIMLLKLPVILSNSFIFHLLFSKLFPG